MLSRAQVSVWDARAGGSAGLVARVPLGLHGGPMYAVRWCGAGGGLLGAAGSDRSLYMVEPRK